MESVIVEVYIPATSASYDFRLPSSGRIGDVIREVIRVLEATQQNLTFDREHAVLCDRDREAVLAAQDTVAEAGLHDGSKLILL